ncbi:putative quinol monooxygenase [Vibrio mediterranei]|uniref:putative quinol monooxygenase n=1 Tax=Vibrio mediterranei TaxID=689 RepID=UPI00148C9C4E|nr:putative quinol monooxygenase [Vibrio mediterranei]NOI26541.1 antibiotic biosynthesis monooxygenase [Vibrio mediterranei]
MSEINVIATLHVVEYAKSEVKAQMKKLVTLSRAEAGCLRYDFYQIDTVGLPGIKNTGGDFTVIESWKNSNALKSHSESDHFTAFISHFSDAEMEITLQIIEKV